MNRRGFLQGAAYVTSYLALGLTVPKCLGESAGGFYAPIPKDMGPYMNWREPVGPSNYENRVQRSMVWAAWAPEGATHAALALFCGTIIIRPFDTRRVIDAKHADSADGMRSLLDYHHEPGWFKVLVTRDTGRVDAEGEAILSSEEVWKRIGYLKWLTVEEVAKIGSDRMVIAA